MLFLTKKGYEKAWFDFHKYISHGHPCCASENRSFLPHAGSSRSECKVHCALSCARAADCCRQRAPHCPPRWMPPTFSMKVLKLASARSKLDCSRPVQGAATKQTEDRESDDNSAAVSTQLKSQGFPVLVVGTSLLVRACGAAVSVLGSLLFLLHVLPKMKAT